MRLLFVSEKKPFLRLKSILGFYPHNIKLYELALMHKSVARYEQEMKRKKRTPREKREERKQSKKAGKQDKISPSQISNERLEFLGDAVLGAIVADILYRHYGNKQEGFLTMLRSKIVCRSTLNQVAISLGLDKLIHHVGAVTTGHNSFMNGNAFEAFVGAIYLDRGYQYCCRFLEEQVFKKYIDIESMEKQEINFKSVLIEWCQKYQYRFVFSQKESRESGKSNTPIFHSSLFIEGIPCGTGDGYSKKESDQNAAQQALKRIKRDKALLNGIKNAKNTKKSGE
ncbi:MAG: ribonuclease III [Bacteroidaceae bacterium]|nr:ribonuclease III [Bacteroidaceae bacterium]